MEAEEKKLKRLWSTLKKWWMAFARALGWFNTRLLLTAFYIILGIPALILKLIRKDPLDRAFDNRQSYWKDKESFPQTVDRSKHQF
jgi:hypothetical protein